jgi:hypothetical protein
VNAQEQIYFWHQGNWIKLSGQAVWASIGHDGTIWVVNSANQVYKRWGDDWQHVPGSCKQIYVSNADSITCVNAAGQVRVHEDGKWAVVSSTPAFAKIAVSSFRAAVATTASGEIYYKPQLRSADKWQKVPGELRNVGISKDYIVGTNSVGNIYWLDLKK